MSSKQQTGLSWENAVFYVSLAALILVVGTFFYLQYANFRSKEELASLTAEMMKSKTIEQKKLENSVLKVSQELKDFAKILEEQKVGSELFNKLEKVTVQGVYLKDCKLDSSMKISITGHAKDFEVLGQQMKEFEAATDILGEVAIGSVKINDEGGVDFDVKAVFNKEPIVQPAN